MTITGYEGRDIAPTSTADKIAELIRHDHGDVINGLLEILQEQQQQIDAMKDRTTICECCGGRDGEHYPNCPAWARTGGDKPVPESVTVEGEVK